MDVETIDFNDLLNNNKVNTNQMQRLDQKEHEEKNQTVIIRNSLLPLGSVVMLKGAKKRLMISGFYPLNEEQTNKSYDYIACIYPEGLLASEKLAMFNHEDIEKVYQEGLSDNEEIEFKARLKDAFERL